MTANKVLDPFTVTVCVYGGDSAEWFDDSLASVLVNQTVRPSEFLLVVDGSINEDIESIISKYSVFCNTNGIKIQIIRFSKNKGLGEGRREAVNKSSYDIIAVMDSDDLSEPNRFFKQLNFLNSHLDCDIVGGQILEFVDDPHNPVGERIVPLSHDDICRYLKKRSPFNHVSVMFKKSSVLKAGNYIELHYNEDYYLWIRMYISGAVFANLPCTLVNVRVGDEMYSRRWGRKYFKSELIVQKYMLKKRIINPMLFLYNVFIRFVVQIILTPMLRGVIFSMFLRKRYN